MPLIKIKKQEKPQPINYTNPTAALIQRRRLQILLHSYLYYWRNTSLISDSQWAEWAKELVELQNQNPELSKQLPHYDQFKDFDPSTGFNLIYPSKIRMEAEFLVEYHERNTAVL